MKNMKNFGKRSLSVLLALVMCLGMLQLTVFAAEEHTHNEGGWECAWTDAVTGTECAHTGHDGCGYSEGTPAVPCDCTPEIGEDGSLTHTADCSAAPAVEGTPCGHVCGEGCVKLVADGYWTCVAPEAPEAPRKASAVMKQARSGGCTVVYTDGVSGETLFADQETTVQAGDPTPAFSGGAPTRKGYEFRGWAPTVNPTVKADDADADGVICYVASWQVINYKVVYTDGLDGEVFGDRTFDVSLKHGDATPAFGGTPTHTSYTFMGWSPALKPTIDADDADRNNTITYTAQWCTHSKDGDGNCTEDNCDHDESCCPKDEENTATTYTVYREYYHPDPEEGKIARTSTKDQHGNVGETIVGADLAAAAPSFNKRAVDGIDRIFRFESSDPDTLTLAENPEKDETINVITLKYVYAAMLTYDANGGDNPPAAVTAMKDWDTRCAAVTVAGKGSMTKSGYSFLGWSTDKDAKTADTAYTPGKAIDLYQDTTLYAVWGIVITADQFESTYTGAEQELPLAEVTVKLNGDKVPADQLSVREYRVKAGENAGELGETGKPQHAGDYTAVLEVKDENGVVIGEVEAPFIIKPATLTATYKGETIVEGETPRYEVEVKGFVGGETAETLKAAGNYTAPTVSATETLVGGKTYELTPTGGSARNYEFDCVSGNLIVAEKGKLIIEVNSAEYIYNAKPQGIDKSDVTVKDKDGNELPDAEITITYKDEAGNELAGKPTDAGEYTAVIKAEADGKESDPTDVPFTIKPATLTATYAGETITAGGAPAGTVNVTGFVGGENAGTAAGYKAPGVNLAGVNTSAAGTYTLTPAGGEAKNYVFNYVSGALTVRSGGGGGGGGGGGVTPTPTPDPVIPDVEPPLTEIPDEEPPLAEEPGIEIDEPDVPLAGEPGIEIEDPDVPLADVPKTGDNSGVWTLLTLLSGAGLAWLALEDRKRRTNAK